MEHIWDSLALQLWLESLHCCVGLWFPLLGLERGEVANGRLALRLRIFPLTAFLRLRWLFVTSEDVIGCCTCFATCKTVLVIGILISLDWLGHIESCRGIFEKTKISCQEWRLRTTRSLLLLLNNIRVGLFNLTFQSCNLLPIDRVIILAHHQGVLLLQKSIAHFLHLRFQLILHAHFEFYTLPE